MFIKFVYELGSNFELILLLLPLAHINILLWFMSDIELLYFAEFILIKKVISLFSSVT